MFLGSEFFVGVIIGWFMYEDAKSRKLENPTTWFFIGWLLGLIGLATYWYWHIRPNAEEVAKVVVKSPKKSKAKAKK